MATMNPFDILDDDTEDPSLILAAVEKQKLENPKKAHALTPAQPKSAKLPTKPPPPAQAVREAKNEFGRGGGRGAGRGGRGRGGGSGYNRDSRGSDNSNGFTGGYRPSEEGEGGRQFERRGGYDGPRGSFRGGRRGGFNNGEPGEGERPRRQFDRHSGTGRGNEYKRDGAGRGNWGGATDEIVPKETEENVPENEKKIAAKQSGEEDAADANKENAGNEPEEKEPENKVMTLEEYEKVLEEKRKALLAIKTDEGRKVDVKEFASMQQLSNKKSNDEIFIKLGSEKDKRKDGEKEEKVKKSVSINEFLKPAEGEKYYGLGHGRGRGRGSRGGYVGNTGSNVSAPTPKIEDPGHFPSLGGK